MIWIILMVFGLSAFLSIMLFAIVLPIKPDILQVFGKFVCSKDEKIEVLTSTASYHQPGERSIEIYCNDYGKRRNVKGKVLLFGFLLSFFITFPLAGLFVLWVFRLLN